MKSYVVTILNVLVCFCIIFTGCEQENINGIGGKAKKVVYFPDANQGDTIAVPVLSKYNYTLDKEAKTINFPIPVYRTGFAETKPFTVNVSADNSKIDQMITSGVLPENTVALTPDDYVLASKSTLSMGVDHLVKGEVIPKIKAMSLEQYSGKVVALGIQLTGSSRYSVDAGRNTTIIYFPVDSVVGKIYLPAVGEQNKLVSLLKKFTFDSASNTLSYPILIRRNGFADLDKFTVDVTVDNNLVTDLKNAGKLPSNTVTLSSSDYSFISPVDVSLKGEVMQGKFETQINTSKLRQYKGKIAALGLVISGSSKFNINTDRNKIVLYFDVDSLLDSIFSPHNLIMASKWDVMHIANDDKVQVTFNSDSSAITFLGGDWGHMAVYQKVEVVKGRNYKINMHVKGSGTSENYWFEAYVGTTIPQDGSDYKDNKRISLNTWSGCGKAPFDGSLAQLSCDGPGNVVSFPTSGFVYVVIKSGGPGLGATGITASDIVFIMQK